ncbi:MAG: hypothetical protein AAF358_24475 [Pseudomonadota bacterium]
MKIQQRLTAAAAILTFAMPALASAEQASLDGTKTEASERQIQVELGGKPPHKRRFVDSADGGEPILIVGDDSGTLGRIGPPSRPGRSTQPLRSLDPTETEAGEFARFEEVGNTDQKKSQAGNPARRYKGAPGKHARISVRER